MPSIADIFSQLDEWRQLPSYQLERRADIFFALYLPQVLEQVFAGDEIGRQFLAELPVRLSLVAKNDLYQSFKIDYALFSKRSKKAYLVELKTDMNSRQIKQDQYLANCGLVGMPAVIRGVIEIAKRPRSSKKYFRLLESMEAIGLVSIPEGVGQRFRSEKPLRKADVLSGVTLAAGVTHMQSELVYVQPRGCLGSARCITFHEFADIIETIDDGIAPVFADSLRRWAVDERSPRS